MKCKCIIEKKFKHENNIDNFIEIITHNRDELIDYHNFNYSNNNFSDATASFDWIYSFDLKYRNGFYLSETTNKLLIIDYIHKHNINIILTNKDDYNKKDLLNEMKYYLINFNEHKEFDDCGDDYEYYDDDTPE